MPEIRAEPLPLTSPSSVTLPPLAHSRPSLATSLCTTRPPLPVASSVPVLTMVLPPVSMTERVAAGGDDGAFVDQRHLPVAELAGAGDGVVDVGERDARDRCRRSRSRHCRTAPPCRRPASVTPCWTISRSVSLPVEPRWMAAGVVDDAAERQQCAVADHHVAGVVGDRRLVELEVAGIERCRADAVQRDGLAIGERDHGIARRVGGRDAPGRRRSWRSR